eukprot:TRINITY_DN9168_c0_g1_i2.p1 TRINITY_DN9168_c0_g1~~TRINITY_DN9168_c0_g1_i2.p1  ORF type:complete len:319 (-),score=62.59 TRINITY_DN9168_c0_g1_i2:334-1290(-)
MMDPAMYAAAAAASDGNSGASFMWIVNQPAGRGCLEDGAEANRALRLAVFGGAQTVVEYLLDHKADPNAQGDDLHGGTPLMIAADEGLEAMTKTLIDRRASVNTPSKVTGEVPLTRALLGSQASLQLLIQNKADLDFVPTVMTPGEHGLDGQTALHLAVRRRMYTAAKLLLENRADPNPRNSRQISPLMRAVELGDREMAAILVRAGADPRMKNDRALSCLQLAHRDGQEDVMQVMLGTEYIELCKRLEQTSTSTAGTQQLPEIHKAQRLLRGLSMEALPAPNLTHPLAPTVAPHGESSRRPETTIMARVQRAHSVRF